MAQMQRQHGAPVFPGGEEYWGVVAMCSKGLQGEPNMAALE